MRSPMMQNGRSGPMTIVLDRECSTVCTGLSLLSSRNTERPAEPRDAVAAEADQVQSGDARLLERVLGELPRELKTVLLSVSRAPAPLDELVRHADPRHVVVDE